MLIYRAGRRILPVDLIIVSFLFLLFLIYNALFLHNFVKKVNKTNHKHNLPMQVLLTFKILTTREGGALYVQGPEQRISLLPRSQEFLCQPGFHMIATIVMIVRGLFSVDYGQNGG